jgi:hypothetical protein
MLRFPHDIRATCLILPPAVSDLAVARMYPGNTNHTHTPLPVLHTGYLFDLAARLYQILPSPVCIRGVVSDLAVARMYPGNTNHTHAPLPVLHTGYLFDLAARLYRILP